ncbi:HIT family protein [Vitreoscilla massiliensis]|uniref:HIT family protein n=1 Tax=Vitreoscilla massiliensis TaxID=1689272 RepID=A0ABY4E2A1_9NEIS|nr:HIT family protein [Vitreoscilla massiliensis]UOO89903.1 HIT family protein [Vitreoscilla massiliensis]
MLNCPLCEPQTETVLYQNEQLRVILVTDQVLAPAYCRVIWQQHVAEMTDLSEAERQQLMDMVYLVEHHMREILQPKKINLASFGTMVPHQHWHVIARFEDDAYYPDSIWSNAHHHHTSTLPDDWVQRLQTALQTH